ncbi:MAG: hypothetical protein H7306_10610, partial [Bacteriovorax sp.]|nr:hypothetical protein [Rhizobacter sp.]
MNELPRSAAPSVSGRVERKAQAVGWARWLPGLQTLRHYEIAWLRHDVVAGLV